MLGLEGLAAERVGQETSSSSSTDRGMFAV